MNLAYRMQQLWKRDRAGFVRNIIQAAKQRFLRLVIPPVTAQHWPPYSRLLLVSDHPSWSISWDMWYLAAIARHIGVQMLPPNWLPYIRQQAVFYGSQFRLLAPGMQVDWSHHLGTAYFHGLPGTGSPEFDQVYQQLCQVHPRIERVQVSHSQMHEVVLSSGIAPEKVFRIPIGIDLAYFSLQTPATRTQARQQLGIPASAVVVGSFQKDGVGWGEGREPKLIKGPDLFLQTVALLQQRVPELFVLLSGPARGYVKAGLERLGLPYRHIFLEHYPDIAQLYHALDVYIVASRQEGGPKAVLESMASGVPLVTTRVGQAMDLVQHGENGWMVDVEDAAGLAYWAEYSLTHEEERRQVLQQARQTAETNTYASQVPLWRKFLRGLVVFDSQM